MLAHFRCEITTPSKHHAFLWRTEELPFVPSCSVITIKETFPDGRIRQTEQRSGPAILLSGGGTVSAQEVYYHARTGELMVDCGVTECSSAKEIEAAVRQYEKVGWSDIDPRRW